MEFVWVFLVLSKRQTKEDICNGNNMLIVLWHNIEIRLDQMRIKCFSFFLIVEVTDINTLSVMRKSRDVSRKSSPVFVQSDRL